MADSLALSACLRRPSMVVKFSLLLRVSFEVKRGRERVQILVGNGQPSFFREVEGIIRLGVEYNAHHVEKVKVFVNAV